MAYDSVIIGGGVNALTAASYLAKSGKKVAVACSANKLHGTQAKHEFHPGYKSPGILNNTSMFRSWIIKDLGLEAQGLQYDETSKTMAFGKDNQIALSLNDDETAKEIAKLSESDAKNFLEMKAFYKKVKTPISEFLNNIPPDLVDPQSSDLVSLMKRAFQLRTLGKKDMLEVLRLAPMTIYDWLDEYFESDMLKAAIALPAVTESYTAPWSPGTNANLLIHEVTKAKAIDGDGLALISALEKAAIAFGVKFESDSDVSKIEIGKGVHLENGSFIEAKTIFSAVGPKEVFLEMMNANELSHKFEQRMMNFRTRGLSSQLLIAVNKAPDLDESINRAIIADDLDAIEKAFDPIKYDEVTDNPSLEVYFPSKKHADLAPEGHAVISVLVHYTPYELKGGWTDKAKSELTSNIITILDKKMPGLKSTVVATSLLTPKEIEKRYRLTGGQLFEGEHALDQLLIRPTPECSQYKTPFEGLYLCSGGSFPGGGLTGAPAALAVKRVH